MDKSKKILYIDDDQINVELFEINFSEKYDVVCGASGNEGLNLLEETTDIKIIITDMKMPGMSGIDFIKKAREKFSDKIFFLLTGYNITSDIQNALDAGLIQQCFCKPFNKSEIETSIEKADNTVIDSDT
jgi:CheY-like chemotaxis protein